MGNIDRMIHLLIATTKYCSEYYRMQGKKLLSVVILRLLERYVVGVTSKCQFFLSPGQIAKTDCWLWRDNYIDNTPK